MLLSIFGILICICCKANVYYIDAAAGSNGTGSLNNPWNNFSDLDQTVLFPGDIVYVKAGEYLDQHIVMKHSGLPNLPIVFKGYKSIPGDQPEAQYPRYGLNEEDMPTLSGTNPGEGIAIDLNGHSHIVLENFQIRNFRLGIRNMRAPHEQSNHIVLENIVGHTFGLQVNGKYSGWGILVDDQHWSLKNCEIIDAGAECFGIYGDYNQLRKCHAANYSDINATDYFIMTWGNSNIFEQCTVHRASYISSHSGHGIGVKNGANNQFLTCLSVNTNKGFYVSGPQCHHNYFGNCVAQNEVGLVVREGAHHNTFDACVITNTEVAVRFFDSEEYGEQPSSAGSNNLFVNCLFEHNKTAIDMWDGVYNSPVQSNLFANCIFNDAINFFSTKAPNQDNLIVNSVIYNIQLYKENTRPAITEHNNYLFRNCRLWKNDFSKSIISGDGNIETDPLFLNASNSDFRPNQDSNLIDAGLDSLITDFDFMGTFRPYDGDNNGSYFMDIGIYEFTEELLLADSSANQIASGQIDPFNYEDSIAVIVGQNQVTSDFYYGSYETSKYRVYPTLLNGDQLLKVFIEHKENCPQHLSLSDGLGDIIAHWEPCSEEILLPLSVEGGIYFLNFFHGKSKEVHRLVIQ